VLAKASSNLLDPTHQTGIYINDEWSFITSTLLMQTEEISETSGFNSTPAQLIARGDLFVVKDRLCGLLVRVPGYRSRGPGFDSWTYQIF
jgi:hypothetical protein